MRGGGVEGADMKFRELFKKDARRIKQEGKTGNILFVLSVSVLYLCEPPNQRSLWWTLTTNYYALILNNRLDSRVDVCNNDAHNHSLH